MSVASFIPKLWEGILLEKLRDELVYGNLVNRDYEGEIKAKGNSVTINDLADVTIKDYTGADIATAEDLTTEGIDLIIDQQKYYNFRVKDVDKAQAAGDLMEKAMESAAYGMANTIDTHLAKILSSDSKSVKIGSDSAPKTITEANAYAMLLTLKVALDKASVPKQGRWVVVPSDYEAMLLLDNRFVGGGTPQSNERLTNGFIGRAGGFDVYTSNNVPNTSNQKYKIVASHKMTASLAEQLNETKAYSEEKNFSDAVKGLAVYGAKVTRPTKIAVMTANFTAQA